MALNNNDLLMEVLLLLPAKSLIRFKSVCKRWLSLVSSDHFCHQHTLRHPKLQQSLILETDSKHFYYFNQTTNGRKVMTPYSLSVPNHFILQDCNGLLLLEAYMDQSYNDEAIDNLKLDPRKRKSYCVYNPTTKQSRKITLTNTDNFPYVAAIGLAFDPSKSPYYKIVCIGSTSHQSSTTSPCTYQIEVYDSESHTWKLSLEPFASQDEFFFDDDIVYWKNSIHWDNGYSHCNVFDIAKNKFKVRTLPSPRCCDTTYLQVSNGHLCRLHMTDTNHTTQVVVWELKSRRDKWLLKYNHPIHHHSPIGSAHQATGDLHIQAARIFMGGSDSDSDRLLIYEQGKMRAYNFLDRSYEEIADLPNKRCRITGFQFGEVLALV